MCRKIPWTRIAPLLHGFQYLTEQDEIFYHLEHSREGYQKSPGNSLVSNYKKDVSLRNEKQWYYKEDAIRQFAALINMIPFENNCILLAGATSKQRNGNLFDSRNDDVIKIVNNVTKTLISFNLEAVQDIEPTHLGAGYRSPEKLKNFYKFTPFEIVPDVVYIVDDVITSSSQFIVWRDLIHQAHPDVKVRGIYLARTVGET